MIMLPFCFTIGVGTKPTAITHASIYPHADRQSNVKVPQEKSGVHVPETSKQVGAKHSPKTFRYCEARTPIIWLSIESRLFRTRSPRKQSGALAYRHQMISAHNTKAARTGGLFLNGDIGNKQSNTEMNKHTSRQADRQPGGQTSKQSSRIKHVSSLA